MTVIIITNKKTGVDIAMKRNNSITTIARHVLEIK